MAPGPRVRGLRCMAGSTAVAVGSCAAVSGPQGTHADPASLTAAAGPAAALPDALVGLHWFVQSLATPMTFTLTQGAVPPVRSRALAHFEGNWGLAFPSTWHWAQGINASWPSQGATAGAAIQPKVDAAFVLAGGRVPATVLQEDWLPDMWLLGVRTPRRRHAALPSACGLLRRGSAARPSAATAASPA